MIWSDRRLTIREIAEDLNISYGSIQNILTRFEHEASECKICSKYFDGRTKATAFVNFFGVVWLCCLRFQLFRKCCHGRWNLGLWLWSWDQGSEFSMEITQFSSCEKKHLNQDPTSRWWWLFFDLDGIVRAEFVPRNTTVNSEYYKGLLERLRNYVCRKRPEKWANSFILHHDNVPCHTSLLVWPFLSNKNITVCPHPPYLPDLALCDFWLFPKVKMTMKGKCFELIQDIEAATTVELKTFTKEDFQNYFRKWQERWDKCVQSEGD